MRKPLVIANWKMNGSRLTLAALASALKPALAGLTGDKGIDVVLCPPFVFVPQLAEQLAGSVIALGAQDLSAAEKGPHTGDISGAMLKDFGCRFVLVGHSERRAHHGESDALVAQKVQRALACGLQPVLCIGETLAEHEAGKTLEIVGSQFDAVYGKLAADVNLVIAYEPIWAIGSGKTAMAQQVQEVHRFIRGRLGKAGEHTRIIYGGSVKPENAKALFSQADIDGGLIGGAALVASEFIDICKAAAR
jgi:triosephosphate isomerase